MTLNFQFYLIIGIILALNMGCKAAPPPPCPSVAEVNNALRKCTGDTSKCKVKIGPWEGTPYGATQKFLTIHSPGNTRGKRIVLFGKPSCYFQTNNVKLYMCQGPCHKK